MLPLLYTPYEHRLPAALRKPCTTHRAARSRRAARPDQCAESLVVLLSVMAASICCGLRSSSVAPASSAAFEQLCQITTGTKGTVSADILFGVAHSSIASTDLASPATPATPAFQHLFGPIAHGAQLFTSASSQYYLRAVELCQSLAFCMW